VLFDQQGCLSPQAVYVEREGEISPQVLAEGVAEACAGLAGQYPRRQLSAAEAAAIHQYRAEVEMRSLTETGARLWVSPGSTGWTVALDPNPQLMECCLNRTVILRPVADLGEVLPGIEMMRGQLISAGLEAGDARRRELVETLGEAGVTRITRLGKAQEPASALYHDGINALATLARFVTVER
jgi:hypothetical protein